MAAGGSPANSTCELIACVGWGIPAGAVETPTNIPVESAGGINAAAAVKEKEQPIRAEFHGMARTGFETAWSGVLERDIWSA